MGTMLNNFLFAAKVMCKRIDVDIVSVKNGEKVAKRLRCCSGVEVARQRRGGGSGK